MIVQFYLTGTDGDTEIAMIQYSDGRMTQVGDSRVVDMLFNGIDRSSNDEVQQAMQGAPRRFDGVYLRAAYSNSETGELDEASPGWYGEG